MAEEKTVDSRDKLRKLLHDGMNHFRNAKSKVDLKKSLECFDEMIAINTECKKTLWQRGLTLFYLDAFKEGAEQFRYDVELNPNDTEEAIWCYLCEVRIYGKEKALSQWLDVGEDSRPYMRIIYNLFKEKNDKQQKEMIDSLLQMIKDNQSEKHSFYANLYLGLFYESLYCNDKGKKEYYDKAKKFITSATQSKYTNDYMYSLSVVHKKLRGWSFL